MQRTREVIKINDDKNSDTGGGASDARSRRKQPRRVDDAETLRAANNLIRLQLDAQKQRVWIAIWTLLLTAIMAVTGQLPRFMEVLVNRVAVDSQLKRTTTETEKDREKSQ